MEKQKSLLKNSFFSILKSVSVLLFPLISFPYASRILLPEGIGKINYINSIVDYFVLIAGLGISTYGTREAAKVRDNKLELSKFTKEISSIYCITTLIAYILFFIAFFFLERLESYRTLLLISSIRILLITFGIEWLYNANEDFQYITIRTLFFQVISCTYLFIFVHSSDDINHYMIFTIISSTGSNILNLIHSRKYINWTQKTRLELKKHLRPIFILFGTALAISVFSILDSAMLGWIKGNEEVGYYSAAVKINKMVLGVITALNSVLLPRLSYYAENDPERYKSLLIKSSNILQAMAIPVSAGLLFFSGPLTLLLCGKNYTPSIPCMQVISLAIFFIIFGGFLNDQIFLPFRKDKFSLIPVIIGAVVNFCLNLLFIPRYGALGASFATLLAEASIATTKFFLAKTIFKKIISLFNKTYQYITATTIMILVLLAVNLFIANEICFIILKVVFGTVTYASILFLFRNEYFLNIIDILKNKLSKRLNN